MVPLSIIDFLVDRPGFGSSGAHIKQQVQMAVQHLNGKEVHFGSLGNLRVFWLRLGFPVAEEQKAVGLRGAEVKGDGARLLGVPFVENNERLGCLKRDGVQGGHVLTFKSHSAMDLHLGIAQLGQPGQFESHVIVFVHNLEKNKTVKVVSQPFKLASASQEGAQVLIIFLCSII